MAPDSMFLDESWYRSLFDGAPHPYLVLRTDPQFSIAAVNDRYLAATGTRREDIVGRGLFDVFPDNPDDLGTRACGDLHASLDRVLRDRCADVMGVQKYDIPLRDGSGRFETKYWSPVNTPVFGADGDVRFIIHHVEDVTDFMLARTQASADGAAPPQRAQLDRMEAEIRLRSAEVKEANRHLKQVLDALEQREAELARLNERLTELDRAKSAFFSNVSHEFRTPLTLMLAPLEDMLSARSEAWLRVDRSVLELVQRNALRMLKLVNALLDFTRLGAGRGLAHREPTDLASFTAELASNFRAACERAGLRLVIDCPPLPRPVSVDQDMWERIVLNLLSNAFKFTFEGVIEIRLRAVGDEVELIVRDTGTGIPADEIPHLFERFHRVEGARGRSKEGAGIGLALVDELTRLHGGSVRVDSTLGAGSRFILRIPFGASGSGAEPRQAGASVQTPMYVEEALRWLPGDSDGPEPAGVTHGRVLVADDNADMRDYIERLLADAGYRVETVGDGQRALALCLSDPPDLLLTDVMMPGLDGFELLQRLRQDTRTHTLPIILLSARAGEESRVQGLDAGADDYLVKPFHGRELVARVESSIRLARVRGEALALLQESESQYRAVVEDQTELISRFTTDGRLNFVNDVYCRFFGKSRQELTGSRWHPVAAAEDLPMIEAKLATLTPENPVVLIEHRVYSGDGGLHWMQFVNRAFFDANRQLREIQSVGRDITDLRRATERLARSERRLALALAAARMGVWEWDCGSETLNWSAECCVILGVGDDVEQTLGGILRYVHPQDADRMLMAVRLAMANKTRLSVEFRIIRPDGELRWLDTQGETSYDEQGRPQRVYGTVQDVSERKRWETELRDSEERLRLVMDSTQIAVFISDDQGQCRYANPSALRTMGYTLDRLQQMQIADLVVPQDLPRLTEHLRATAGGENRFQQWSLKHEDGHGIPFELSIQRLPDGRILVIGLDITERLRAEQQLRLAASVFESAHEGIMITDVDRRIVDVNQAFTELTGYERNEVVGQHPAILRSGLQDDAFYTAMRRAYENQGYWHGEIWNRRKDGRLLAEQMTISSVRNQAGEPTHYIALFTDITERKNAEAQLLTHQVALEESARRKDVFIATLSHELRNPLAAISNAIMVLQHVGLSDPKLHWAVQTIGGQSQQLIRLVDDLLDVSRITHGKVELKKVPTLIAELVERAVETSRPIIEHFGHRLQVSVPPQSMVVNVDPVRIVQVIDNLLNNAAKYTPPGGRIWLTVDRVGDDASICVRDNGIGIGADLLPQIFEPFRQGPQDLARPRTGLGIGLSLTRRLVDMHGGVLSAASDGPHRGSEFTVRLPLAETMAARRSVADKTPASPIHWRILVVDDEPAVADSFAMLLEVMGHQVQVAHDGEQALKMAADDRPQLIVLDIGLPGMDGYELLRRLRAMPELADVPVVALTGYGQRKDIEKSQAAGFFRHLVKPLNPSALEDLLASLPMPR